MGGRHHRGLIDAGGYVIAGIDKDERCRSTYIKNNKNKALDRAKSRFLHYDVFPRTARYRSGQQEELFAELDELIPPYRRKARGIPLLFAICAPCQPFTRLSKKELRGTQGWPPPRPESPFRSDGHSVDLFAPELVLSENVPRIGDPKYGGVWESFRKGLEALGYVTGSKVVCASRFGIPQYKEAFYFIGRKARRR